MIIEPVGLVTLLIGLLVVWRGPQFGIYALTVSCLLGAAAVMKLPALGDANIQPVHVILCCYALTILLARSAVTDCLKSVHFPGPGVWCVAFVLFCVLSALLLPRLFEGETQVLSLARSQNGEEGFVLIPLMPSSGNLTQSVYILADLVLFVAVSVQAMRGGLTTIMKALLVAGAINLCFGLADLLTYLTGTAELMSVIRNANYAMQVGVAIGGVKRLAR